MLKGLRAVACMGVLVTTPVEAVQFQVRSETQGDAYQLVTSDNELLNRRRLHHYLGLSAYDLTGDGTNAVRVNTLIRFDGDFGITDEEDVGLFRQHQLSVQTAVVEARDLGGFFDFDLGRFLHADAIDFMMLDGGRFVFHTPWFFKVELLAGLETTWDQAAINDTQFQLDGLRIIADENEAQDLAADHAPTIVLGAALSTDDLLFTQLRMSYRRLFSDGAINQEKIGVSMVQRLWQRVFVSGMGSYDMYNGFVDRGEARVSVAATDFLDFDVQYVHLRPSFDADSIFNIFASEALNDANLRMRFHVDNDSRVHLGGMMRFYGHDQEDELPDDRAPTEVKAYGVMGGGYWRIDPKIAMRADATYESGYGGERVVGELGLTWRPLPQLLDFDVRSTVVHFDDALQPKLEGLSIGYHLGVTYRIDHRARISLAGEHNFNRLHISQFRLFVLADLNFFL